MYKTPPVNVPQEKAMVVKKASILVPETAQAASMPHRNSIDFREENLPFHEMPSEAHAVMRPEQKKMMEETDLPEHEMAGVAQPATLQMSD